MSNGRQIVARVALDVLLMLGALLGFAAAADQRYVTRLEYVAGDRGTTTKLATIELQLDRIESRVYRLTENNRPRNGDATP